MMIHGFNVGDRVVRIEGKNKGQTATVIEHDEDPDFVYIVWDESGGRYGSYPHNIRLIDQDPFDVDEDL